MHTHTHQIEFCVVINTLYYYNGVLFTYTVIVQTCVCVCMKFLRQYFGNFGASNTRYTLFLISPTISHYFDHRYRIPGISCDLFTQYKNSSHLFLYDTLTELKDYYYFLLLLLFLYKNIPLLLFVLWNYFLSQTARIYF